MASLTWVRYETRYYWGVRLRHALSRIRPWAWLLLLPPLAAVGFVPRACSALDVATQPQPACTQEASCP